MSNVNDLIERYIATWNETDAERRRTLIAQTWTEKAFYLDPMMKGEGQAGIDAMIAGVQSQFPGFKFTLSGTPDAHNDVVRFSWDLGPEGVEPPVKGTDFAEIAADGRLKIVVGFLDKVPAAA